MISTTLKKRLSIVVVFICIILINVGCGKVNGENDTQKSTDNNVITTQSEQDTTATTSETKNEETTPESNIVNEPINFIMFGIDTHGFTMVDIDKSDMLMCVSLDPKSKTIKFISILRDTKAAIEGHDPQKINAAYQFGGAQLAIDTVNQNFGLEYSDYITLDWSDVAELIDIIGGVDIEITDAEAENINYLVSVNYLDYGKNGECSSLNQGGLVHLDGTQAMMFCRIRKIDSDYYRAGRQQRTLRAIIEKIKSMPITEYPALIKTFKETVEETSFTVEDILTWTTMGLDKYEIEGYIIPDPDYEENLFGGVDETGSWVWIYDMKSAGDRLKKILNGEFKE